MSASPSKSGASNSSPSLLTAPLSTVRGYACRPLRLLYMPIVSAGIQKLDDDGEMGGLALGEASDRRGGGLLVVLCSSDLEGSLAKVKASG